MKAQYIIHAVGPKFLEEDLESKLAKTVHNALEEADKKGITRVALPAMGAGFYGVPIETSAEVTVDSVSKYLQNASNIQEVVLCVLDSKQYKAFQQRLAKLA
jgi:O-acetyl-ADP-ribose deacetylase (regulator of RNase III)